MTTPAHRFPHRLVLLAGLLGVSVHGADVETIVAPAKRAVVLNQARGLLAPRPAAVTTANPFYTVAFYEALANVGNRGEADSGAAQGAASRPPQPAGGGRNNRELLQAIATSLKPSGFFVLGGQPTLVFGQKRVRAGGLLTITYEGKEYTLEVTALDRTNFTLRLNREEFTRPIK